MEWRECGKYPIYWRAIGKRNDISKLNQPAATGMRQSVIIQMNVTIDDKLLGNWIAWSDTRWIKSGLMQNECVNLFKIEEEKKNK